MTVISTYNEPELLLRVSQGDEAAFSALFHHWQPFLTTHIYRITESRELAEETVQDVFLKLWMTREALAGIGHFKAYLLTVSRNHALNALKSLMRRLHNQARFEREGAESLFGDDEPANKLQLSLLDEAIESLSARQKEIYLLHRHQRLSYAEIAEKLGIGRESVKTHLQLAVRSITKHVKQRLALLILLLEAWHLP
ncbi:sigma-70 family RNA polymerase sigma factor [Chitinophaga sp.]|uniref:RNA polymerase sigma factor n=1 Tax=Chitinophaga sp. TaxID=1869181 RepID=UPI00261A44C6|nr:sigma-70 family RNA polymerase sigma factor [uncultured Chitinophaga sp.]